MSTVYAVDTAQVMMPDESMVLVCKDEPWESDSPVVRLKPELFRSTPAGPPPTSIGPDGIPVEQATAAPGEKRNVRR